MAKFCTNCGSKIEDNASFCANCGYQQSRLRTPVQGQCQTSAPMEPVSSVPQKIESTKKRKRVNIPVIIAGVLTLAIVVGALLIFFKFKESTGSGNEKEGKSDSKDKNVGSSDNEQLEGSSDGVEKALINAAALAKSGDYEAALRRIEQAISDLGSYDELLQVKRNYEFLCSNGGIKVALVTDCGFIDDESYNQACWEGVVSWATSAGAEYNYYQPSEDSNDARTLSVDQAIQEGANVIVMPGYMFGTTLIDTQEVYPDVYFVAVDVYAEDMTYDYETYYEPKANAVCMTFAEEQAGYLAGYAAVKDGYTKLGFLGGMPVPAVIRYGYGFVQGVDAAATELGIDAEVKYTYGNIFWGTPEITAKMDGWYENGTEVVFACGGGIYSSALDAANKFDGKVIGVDVDQSNISDRFLTSATKNWSLAVETALNALTSGQWGIGWGGQFINLSLAEGEFVGCPTTANAWHFNDFTLTEYYNVVSEISEGSRLVSDEIDAMPHTYATTVMVF